MTGPYRTAPELPPPPAARQSWWLLRVLRLWWWRRKYRLCIKGDHHPELTMTILRVHLRCTRCGAERPLEGYGPCAYQAVGQWSDDGSARVQFR